MALAAFRCHGSSALLLLVAATWQASALAAAPVPPPPCPATAPALYESCAACHGDDGAGKPELSSPALAGLSEAQLLRQLRLFAMGSRGAHPQDTLGAQMAAMAKTLPEDAARKAVACHVSRLPLLTASTAPPLQLSGGRPGEGAKPFAFCAGCHGADGRGSVAVGAPALVFQSDAYLLRQLQAFAAGWRGHDVNDEPGTQMANAAAWVPDDQTRRDLLAYLGTLRAPVP